MKLYDVYKYMLQIVLLIVVVAAGLHSLMTFTFNTKCRITNTTFILLHVLGNIRLSNGGFWSFTSKETNEKHSSIYMIP